MRRVISLWLPRFATDRLRHKLARNAAGIRRAALPLVTMRDLAGRAILAAVDDLAAAGGAAPEMPLADARSLLPQLQVHPADPAGDGAALRRLADWATRYTPWTAQEAGEEGLNAGGGAGLWLDITGCAHLFGGEAALLSDLLLRLERFGYHARAAIADTPGAAWAVARFIDGRPSMTLEKVLEGRGWIVPKDVSRPALDRLPVAALRLPPAMAAELERLGLYAIGDLLGLPRAGLARRFGGLPLRRLEQALGSVDEPVSPTPPAALFRSFQPLAEPVSTADAIAAALQRLLGDLCRRMEKAQQGARRLELALYRVDGSLQRLAIGTSRPSRDGAALQRLFAQRIERIDPGFGIEAMALAATKAEPLTALQMVLKGKAVLPLPSPASRPSLRGPAERGGKRTEQDAALAPLIDTLANRLGFANVRRIAPSESHIPERAVAMAEPFADGQAAAWPLLPPRPLRLFARPHAIEATALLPDHPPVMFRWQSRLHRIRRAEGPERIEAEWWRPEEASRRARDYFRVEGEDGRRFWLFREGLPPDAGRWYLHGLFS
ncbi:MAG TPA: DNA polymerase Y family protein [Dongiaceae bacterium]|jgi:protein ImuB